MVDETHVLDFVSVKIHHENKKLQHLLFNELVGNSWFQTVSCKKTFYFIYLFLINIYNNV